MAVVDSRVINGRTVKGGAVSVRTSRITLANTQFSCNLDASEIVPIATDVYIADDLDPTKDGSFVSCSTPDGGIIIKETLDFVNTDCPFADPSVSGCPA
jgi:hypothetical protein